jgi:hypothetical protein
MVPPCKVEITIARLEKDENAEENSEGRGLDKNCFLISVTLRRSCAEK